MMTCTSTNMKRSDTIFIFITRRNKKNIYNRNGEEVRGVVMYISLGRENQANKRIILVFGISKKPPFDVPEQELSHIIQRADLLRIPYTNNIKSCSIILTRISYHRSYIFILQRKPPP